MIEASFEERVESLALKLLREGDPAAEDLECARRAARARLLESEERIFDPAVTDPEHDGVVRRTSSETAARGDVPGARYAHDGE
jgi:hypothetical protein